MPQDAAQLGPRIWLDAQVSPAMAAWIASLLRCDVTSIRDLGLRDASDLEIFRAARQAGAILITKDSDFSLLVLQFGAPPQVIWLRCGNTSNQRLKKFFSENLARAMEFIQAGESLVEMTDTVNE